MPTRNTLGEERRLISELSAMPPQLNSNQELLKAILAEGERLAARGVCGAGVFGGGRAGERRVLCPDERRRKKIRSCFSQKGRTKRVCEFNRSANVKSIRHALESRRPVLYERAMAACL
jgi:hypothetical protein